MNSGDESIVRDTLQEVAHIDNKGACDRLGPDIYAQKVVLSFAQKKAWLSEA